MSVFGPEYLKINTVFKRDEKNLIIPGDWSTEEFALLADVPWTWTEKIDGTNIRLHWNGENITVGGRTDSAQIPSHLLTMDVLGRVNDPALWREVFPDSNSVTVFGEGYGPKIQSGGHYRSDHAFIVFDVRVGDWWLKPDAVAEIAEKLGFATVPDFGTMTLAQAVDDVRSGRIVSKFDNARIEGLVGRPAVDLYTRKGDRIVAKIKRKDFLDLERRGNKS